MSGRRVSRHDDLVTSHSGDGSEARVTRVDPDVIRQRIRYEREQLEWSRDRLSKALALVGCRISAQDLYKLEKPPAGRRPRRVRVEELPAFAQVFGLPITELYNLPGSGLTRRASEVLAKTERRQTALMRAYNDFDSALRELLQLMPANQPLIEVVLAASALEGLLIKIVNLGYDLERDLRREVGSNQEEETHGKHPEAP